MQNWSKLVFVLILCNSLIVTGEKKNPTLSFLQYRVVPFTGSPGNGTWLAGTTLSQRMTAWDSLRFLWLNDTHKNLLTLEVSFHWRCPFIGGVLSLEVSFHRRCPFIGGVLSMEVSFQWRCPFNGGVLSMLNDKTVPEIVQKCHFHLSLGVLLSNRKQLPWSWSFPWSWSSHF